MATAITARALPRGERPRERLYRVGAGDVSLQELLAVVIACGSRGGSALEMAYRLLDTFGSLVSLSRASVDDLRRVSGIGTARACQLVAAFELGRRSAHGGRTERISIKSPQDAAVLFMEEMRHHDREYFKAAYLNSKNHVLKVETISIGSLNASIVHPREILKPAISVSSASILLVHNHPTGDPTPSKEDIEFTRRFAKCGELIGIELLDHVVIGAGTYRSMKEMGIF